MATVNIEWSPRHKGAFKIVGQAPLSQTLEEACTKWGLGSSTQFGLFLANSNKEVDLSLSFRLNGLVSGQKLIMKRKVQNSSNSNVTIALQTPQGDRLQKDFQISTTLWELLRYWEENKGINLTTATLKDKDKVIELQPVINYMNREISSTEHLKALTLGQIGLNSGSALLRLLHRAPTITTDQPITGVIGSKTSKQEETSESEPMDIESHVQEQKREEVKQEIPQQKVAQEINKEVNTVQPLNEKQLEESVTAEPIPEHHNVTVFAPPSETISTREPEELPDEFYDVTTEDLRKLVEIAKKKKQDDILKTRKMREKERIKALESYNKIVIRVRFPDKFQLQGEFNVLDKVEELLNFVQSHLLHSERPFYLYTTPPKKKLTPASSTLESHGLLPAAVVYFAWEKDEGVPSGPFLKNETLSMVIDKPATPKPEENLPTPEKVETKRSIPASQPKPTNQPLKVPKWFSSGKKV